ncbi:MAG: type II toxin-antitoxin system VapC family toxin [Deltaproteobacteria bacterium]|jgi:PIN domain nuclease of toxin-antitoxin system|nr:type II toxin-antitoxin system VapC family toxin [Deltaproteobacteria bacterium]
MKLLLDTQMLLWLAAGTLPNEAETLVLDVDNKLYFSSVSIWKICIDKSFGRDDFKVNSEALRSSLLDNRDQELSITSLHILSVNDPPQIHKNPFDRMPIAQPKTEGILLLTSDSDLREHTGPRIFVPKR